MRIGVIGGGIAGLASSWILQSRHEVTLYDRADVVGGHARSISVVQDGATVYVETGFKYFFKRSHPHLLALLRLLRLTPREYPSSLAIVQGAGQSTLVLPPGSLRQWLRLARSPRNLRRVSWLNRFVRSGGDLFKGQDWSLSLGEYLRTIGVPQGLSEEFLLPTVAASWGARPADMANFPAYCVLKLLHLASGERSTYLELDGGISSYIDALKRQMPSVNFCLGADVTYLVRDGAGFHLTNERGEARRFDQLVLATSARDASSLLRDIPQARSWHDILSRFRHFDTTIAIHGDPSLMPPRRSDWALINIFLERRDRPRMTEWSGCRQGVPVFRTWLPPGTAPSLNLHHVRQFHHLLVTRESSELQRHLAQMQGHGGIWVAGMYTTGADNHDSALQSAMLVGRALAPTSPNLQKLQRAVRGE
jgi:predicted NAD/FAD-binding protein